MHLCFDGQEPAQTLHVDDAVLDHHAEIHADAVHQDVDVDLGDAALAKKATQDGDLAPLLMSALLLHIIDGEHRTPRYSHIQNPFPALPDLFLPLLRGPPV